MNKNLFKTHILCHVFPQINDIYFGAVYTPTDTLVCYATNITELKQSLSTAVQEVCDYVDGSITESDFVNALRERELIMRGIIAKHGIPLHPDLYYCLTEYFHKMLESYKPFEYLLPEEVLDEKSDSFIPMWDDRERKFISLEKSLSTIVLCKRLTAAVLKAAQWEPVAGEIYYHPVHWDVEERRFMPMSNQAAFDECPYPAFRTEEECQSVCDALTAIMLEKGTEE